jgi:hypothetical protein
VNHGVQKELMQRMRDVANEFFKLPVEEKEKYAMPSNDIQGYGHAYVVSEEQTLDWSDALMLVIYPNRYRKLQLWPKSPQGFKYVCILYILNLDQLNMILVSAIIKFLLLFCRGFPEATNRIATHINTETCNDFELTQ